jgi:integrase
MTLGDFASENSGLIMCLAVDHRHDHGHRRAKACTRWQESDLVFATASRMPLEARNLVRDSKRQLAAAGLPGNLRFYDMRHAATSLLLADGMPITAVSAMLGHALASTTLKTYAHVLPGADQLTADAMERLLG